MTRALRRSARALALTTALLATSRAQERPAAAEGDPAAVVSSGSVAVVASDVVAGLFERAEYGLSACGTFGSGWFSLGGFGILREGVTRDEARRRLAAALAEPDQDPSQRRLQFALLTSLDGQDVVLSASLLEHDAALERYIPTYLLERAVFPPPAGATFPRRVFPSIRKWGPLRR